MINVHDVMYSCVVTLVYINQNAGLYLEYIQSFYSGFRSSFPSVKRL